MKNVASRLRREAGFFFLIKKTEKLHNLL